jgi:hypothetical protein
MRLLTHPLHSSPTEPVGYVRSAETQFPAGRAAIPVNEPHVAHHLAPPWIVANLSESTDGDPDRYTFNGQAGAATGTSYFLSADWEHVWRPQFRRLVLTRFHAQVELARKLDGVSKPLLVLKDPNDSHGAHATAALVPRSRLILLLRDGRDVVDSHIHAYAPGGWVAEGEGARFESADERLAFVRKISLLWARRANSVLRAWEIHDPALRWRLRYEDLRADPAAELRPIAEWLELGRGDGWVEEAVQATAFDAIPESERGPRSIARAAKPGLWRENLTPDEQEVADEIMGPWLRTLGYAAPAE